MSRVLKDGSGSRYLFAVACVVAALACGAAAEQAHAAPSGVRSHATGNLEVQDATVEYGPQNPVDSETGVANDLTVAAASGGLSITDPGGVDILPPAPGCSVVLSTEVDCPTPPNNFQVATFGGSDRLVIGDDAGLPANSPTIPGGCFALVSCSPGVWIALGSGDDFFQGGPERDLDPFAGSVAGSFGGPGDDTLMLGAGDDAQLNSGTYATNPVRGGPGGDLIDGGEGDDNINGDYTLDEAGSDPGDTGNDILVGGPGNDQLAGDGGNDSLNGGDGIDTMHGGPGNDTLVGGPGDNYQASAGPAGPLSAAGLYGGLGDDTITGGDGRDWIEAVYGADVVDGGPGDDRIDASDDLAYGNMPFPGAGDVAQITCGDGNDLVLFGPSDVVGSDCEMLEESFTCDQPAGCKGTDEITGTLPSGSKAGSKKAKKVTVAAAKFKKTSQGGVVFVDLTVQAKAESKVLKGRASAPLVNTVTYLNSHGEPQGPKVKTRFALKR
jgi:Ca2+-binding RTX toxin-like protein